LSIQVAAQSKLGGMFILRVQIARKARQRVILPPFGIYGACCYIAKVSLSSGNQMLISKFISSHFFSVWPALHVK
jgi:hypothetical protein